MLQIFKTLAFLLYATASFQVKCRALNHPARGFCATGPPQDSLRAEHDRLNALETQDAVAVNYESREVVRPIEIVTWFHILLGSEDDENMVSDEMIDTQLSYLQNAYQNASISYRLEGVTRQINETWSRNGDEMGMKMALREGTYETLNVYFHTDLQASPIVAARHVSGVDGRQTLSSGGLASNVVGFCTLPDPSINGSSPRTSYIKDGCNILAQTMPGGLLANYNRGGTAIHEIGHWNGLLHTFEGESCSSDDPGDYIQDTPQESKPTNGCPSYKNSCPDRPGVDPVHNFMDYSSDECYEAFTPNQVTRMRNMWFSLREGK